MLSNCGAEKTLASPLDSKEIKTVNPKGNQPWVFIGRTDAEAEAPVLWPHDAKRCLTGKDTDAGKDWRQEKKGVTGMIWLDGIINLMDMSLSKLTPGGSEGQESLARCIHRLAKCPTWLSNWTTATPSLHINTVLVCWNEHCDAFYAISARIPKQKHCFIKQKQLCLH